MAVQTGTDGGLRRRSGKPAWLLLVFVLAVACSEGADAGGAEAAKVEQLCLGFAEQEGGAMPLALTAWSWQGRHDVESDYEVDLSYLQGDRIAVCNFDVEPGLRQKPSVTRVVAAVDEHGSSTWIDGDLARVTG